MRLNASTPGKCIWLPPSGPLLPVHQVRGERHCLCDPIVGIACALECINTRKMHLFTLRIFAGPRGIQVDSRLFWGIASALECSGSCELPVTWSQGNSPEVKDETLHLGISALVTTCQTRQADQLLDQRAGRVLQLCLTRNDSVTQLSAVSPFTGL